MSAHARRLIAATGVTLLVWLSQPAPAYAGMWSVPVDPGAVILAFGEAYAGCTHRGVDLSAAAGSEIIAPAGGTVVFAGSVPADGGGSCRAVTVELPEGLRVSLLPLDTVFVSVGESVAIGDALGALAASGDDSSPDAHLHVGLRRGETYVDPTGYLPAAVSPHECPSTSTVSATPSATGGDAAPTAAAAAPGLSAARPVQAPASSTVPEQVPAASESAVSAGGSLGLSVTRTASVVARTPAGGPVVADAGLPVASALDLSRPRSYVRGASASRQYAAPGIPAAAVLVVASIAAIAFLLPSRVAFVRAK